MKKYITRSNVGWLGTIIMSILMVQSIYGKLINHPEVVANFTAGNIEEWITIIGIGELVCLILFIIPRTMKLGTVLLAAYFGGAIMFHMSHPLAEHQGFTGATVFMLLFLAIAWIRGLELIDLNPKNVKV